MLHATPKQQNSKEKKKERQKECEQNKKTQAKSAAEKVEVFLSGGSI